MTHTCHATACETSVPPSMFMCKRHWWRLPAAARKAVWNVYRPGQERTLDVTMNYLYVTARCVEWIAATDGLDPLDPRFGPDDGMRDVRSADLADEADPEWIATMDQALGEERA